MPGEPVVYVVDDDDSVRRSLAWLIGQNGFAVEAYASADEFLHAIAPGERPGCLITDVRMPGMSGLELQQHLVRQGSRLRIIVITGHGDVPTAVDALKAGAVDFLTKPFSTALLLGMIQRCVTESTRAHEAHVRESETKRHLDALTERERQVLDLVLEGETSKVIAFQLGISSKTVEVHRAHLMAKTGAGSLADLMRIFHVNGRPGQS